MKFAAPSRREVGVRTVFNILGPLANPALTNYIVLGVYDEALMEPMAKVLMNLGIKGAMIVHGNDGLDEVTISDRTTVCEIQENKLIKYEITPEDYQIPIVDLNEVIGGNRRRKCKNHIGGVKRQAGTSTRYCCNECRLHFIHSRQSILFGRRRSSGTGIH